MRRFVVVAGLVMCLVVAVAPSTLAGGAEGFERLVAPDAGRGDTFGFTMEVDGNRLVVGAPWDSIPTIVMGSVWVFTRHGIGWRSEKITPAQKWSGGASGGRQFGFDLDVVGDRIVVGCPQCKMAGYQSGGVFLFDYIGGEWVETILESDGIEQKDHMGYQVALSADGTRVLAGAFNRHQFHSPGKVILWELVDDEWVDHVFQPSDGEDFDWFGRTVDFGDGFFAVGAPNHAEVGKEAGAVYIFEQGDDGEWIETKLFAADTTAGDGFGIYLQAQGDVLMVRKDAEPDALYLFGRTENGWLEEVLDLNAPGETGDTAVEGSSLPEIGAILYSPVFGDEKPWLTPGVLRVLERTADEWVEIDRYDGADFGEGSGFGSTVIPFPDTLFVSAPWFMHEEAESGVVFVKGMPPVCGTHQPTILGTNGDDEILGTPGDDVIAPGNGTDLIHVSGGRDVYCLNSGDYRFTGPVEFTRFGKEGSATLVTDRPRPDWRVLIAE